MIHVSTHILDLSSGAPAAGVSVVLERSDGEAWTVQGRAATDADGRVREAFGIDLPLETLFLKPTLGEWSEVVGRAVIADQGEELEDLVAEFEGMSDEEIRALLEAETEGAVE